jgi:alanine racemase
MSRRDAAPIPMVPPAAPDEDAVTMAQGRSRPAWAEVDLAAVAHNAALLARLAAPAELCAVVKAHGYGHGGPAVARAALAGGAGRLAVALVDEGVELREHGITAPVLLLSECGTDAAATALEYGLTPTVYSLEGIEAFATAARTARRAGPVAVHLKVDTGMHRVGASPEELGAVATALAGQPALRLEGLWTHLPVADGERAEDRAFTDAQLGLFDRLSAELEARGIAVPLRHAANTAGAVAFPRSRYDLVRCGLGLYGYLPGATVPHAFGDQLPGEHLTPAMSLKARVVATRRLGAGERPSYGRLRPLETNAVVATVPIGYADGVPRALFGAGYAVLIGGVRRPLAGMVTMDQIVVDCGDDDSVRPGDEVVLLGRQGGDEISADDWAALLGTISYEVVCGVGPRMPRVLVNRPGSAAPAGG